MQKEVKLLLARHKVETFGCLETKVKKSKASRIVQRWLKARDFVITKISSQMEGYG